MALDATKPEIKAVEGLFKVKVKKVNTMPGSRARPSGSGAFRASGPDWKKAMVTLEEGHSIDVTTGI